MRKGILTGKERVNNVFNYNPIDRIPVGEDFWGDVLKKWESEGHITKGESLVEHFDLDLDRAGLINCYIDPGFHNEIVQEDKDTVVILDGNGAKLKQHKHHASTPGHIGFLIHDRYSWEEHAKPNLIKVDRRRIPFKSYRQIRQKAIEQKRHFSSDAWGPFELMQRLCGHENLLMAMALDPDWVRDMVITYVDLNIKHWNILFEEEGLPDSTWIAEDLGFKFKPFMSPQMFREIMLPGYEKMFKFLHKKNLKVILHSCGYIEPLLSDLIAAGMDCLEAMEVKAGMDMPKLFEKYGKKIVFCGNIDIRVLESNEFSQIDNELQAKILPVINNGGGYILHSDHSISSRVEYDTYCYFLDKARNLK